jgi:hypothetical protein
VSDRIDPTLIEMLRAMAREGRTPSVMFAAVKNRFGPSCHIIDIIRCFRKAFCLTLAEAKPLACTAGYTGETGPEVLDELGLDSLILPVIKARATEWDVVDR